jgi:deoxyadenosine/deoxycytidine kinase
MDDEPWDDESVNPEDRARHFASHYAVEKAKVDREMEKLHRIKKIALEGNIGSGKSSVLAALTLNPYIECVPEPVELWANILHKTYREPLKYCFELQAQIAATMMEAYKTPIRKEGAVVRVSERTIFSSDSVFMDLSYMTKSQKSVVRKLISADMENALLQPSAIIYIDTAADTCYENIRRRGRSGEDKITLDYLENLATRTDDWLEKVGRGDAQPKMCTHIINIDGNRPIEAVIHETYYHIYHLANLPGPAPFENF